MSYSFNLNNVSSKEMLQDNQGIREEVWRAADEIKESGHYPTRDEICRRIRRGKSTVSPYFAEWREVNPRPSSAMVSQRKKVVKSEQKEATGNGFVPVDQMFESEPDSELDPVAEKIRRADREAQIIAAHKRAAQAYYERTGNFTMPGLKEGVEKTIDDINEYVNSQYSKYSLYPKPVQEWLKKKKQQQQHPE